MIRSLHIRGYKLFEDLTLPAFGRLNLFVGENNTGKSCLLEAIGLYAGRTPATDIIKVAASRRSDRLNPWDADNVTEAGTSLLHPVFDLFHCNGGNPSKSILIEEVDTHHPLRIDQRLHHVIVDDEGVRRYVPAMAGDIAQAPTEMTLQVFRGDKQVGLVTRRNIPLRIGTATEKLNLHDTLVVAHVPASGYSESQAASMWDALVQGPGQDLVLSWLRIIEPRIQDLAYIGGRLDTRLALVKLEGLSRIPLRSMGDGLTRLFHIGLAMASAAHGVLLIDEFENGLHWKAQTKIWDALASAANPFDVQIFATTHSRDCIQGFVEVSQAKIFDDSKVYRLERIEGNIVALNLPLLNVNAAMNQHSEVR